jgi:hypothetical protein
MPFETGTSTGYLDLMDKLIDFLTVPTPMPANQVWTLLEDRIVPGDLTNQIVDYREIYLRGPGLSATATDITSVTDSGGIARFNFTPGPTLTIGQEVILSQYAVNTDYNGVYEITDMGAGYFEIDSIAFGSNEVGGQFLINADGIHINIRSYVVTTVAGNASNWELGAAINFNPLDTFRTQQGSFTESFPLGYSYVPLIDELFTYYFVGTGRYFWVVAIINGNPKIFGGGFYLPYALPSEFPHPLFVCGNADLPTIRYTDTNNNHINFYNPATPLSAATQASFMRHRDGSWLELRAFDEFLPSNTDEAYLWPVNSANTWGLISNMDDSYTLLPYVIYSGFNGGNVYGEFQNLYWVSEFNITSEDIVQVGGIDHLVIRNIWYSDTNRDYAALRLE